MPYISLYRKYRSRTFDEIYGQDAIVRTLKNAVDSAKVAHAYLFSGPRGTGKTSTARILAKSLNCAEGPVSTPCNKCVSCLAVNSDSHMDVIEIDAASNRKIDDMRELRDNVGYAPAQGQYKVYIIDEVHMLTPEASNALLKTLEEPPAHVIFVLATTEAHQLLPTILSRCQWYEFKRIAPRAMLERLRYIVEAEQIAIQDHTLHRIVKKASGALRDAVGLLDRLVTFSGAEIDPAQALELLGIPSSERVIEFLEAVRDGDLAANLDRIGGLAFEGMDYRQFLGSVSEMLMELLYRQNSPTRAAEGEDPELAPRLADLAGGVSGQWILKAVAILNQADETLRVDTQSKLALEVAAARLHDALHSTPDPAPPRAAAPARDKAPDKARKPAGPMPPAAKTAPAQPSPPEPEPAPEPEPEPAAAPTDTGDWQPLQQWEQLLKALKNEKATLHAVFREARVAGFDGETVTLAFPYEFHMEKALEPASRAALAELMHSLFGKAYEITAVLDDGAQEKPKRKPRKKKPSVEGSDMPPETDAERVQKIFPGSSILD